MATSSSDKRNAILHATLELIAERGFRGTTMALIVQHSGASAGTIYHYFESKDAIIHELYRCIKRQFGVALMAGNPNQLPWPDHLIHIWLSAFRFYAAHPMETRFLEQYENSPYQINWHEHELDEHMAALVQMLHRDIERGLIINLPLEVLYELTLGVAVALAKRQIAGMLTLDERTQTEVAEACLRAVKR